MSLGVRGVTSFRGNLRCVALVEVERSSLSLSTSEMAMAISRLTHVWIWFG